MLDLQQRNIGLGQRPASIQTNVRFGRTGRPMGLGARRGGLGAQHSQRGGNGINCQTYDDPTIPTGVDGCPTGWKGCGDTIGVNVNILANATVDIVIQAGIDFTPRFFLYTGALNTFTLDAIRLANGANSNFGAGYSVDIYALTSFTDKSVSWPQFYNSPGLTLTVTNTTGAPADFEGVLIGVASHQ